MIVSFIVNCNCLVITVTIMSFPQKRESNPYTLVDFFIWLLVCLIKGLFIVGVMGLIGWFFVGLLPT